MNLEGKDSSGAAARVARKITAAVDSLVNFAVLALLMSMLFFGVYALWDSHQVSSGASRTRFEIYKPTPENTMSFGELREINPEVIGWISIYGTNIDYPLVRSSDNMKYLNTAADGSYSLSGAIFLDALCPADFSGYSSVIHGHNMSGNVMFGELKNFSEEDYFNTHRFGNLYFNGRDHGLEIFEYLQADAYDFDVYNVSVENMEERAAFLDVLKGKSAQYRDAGQAGADRIVLLSTCALGYTNGRDILACVITDETFEDNLHQNEPRNSLFDSGRMFRHSSRDGVPLWILSVIILCVTIAVYVAYNKFTIKNNASERGTETPASDDKQS